MLKIDAHVHITPPGIINNWEKYAKKERYFSLLLNSKAASAKNSKFVTAEEVVYEIEKNNFDKAVVFGFAFCDLGLCRYVNDYVIEKIKEFPEKLIGFAVVPAGRKSSDEIERCYNAGLKGVGELFPQGQGINLDDQKQMQPIANTCKDLNIPLLLHANEPVGHYYPGKTSVSLGQIETFVSDNPGLKIILAHFGGGLLFYETMKEIKKKFCNVYYDTAASPFLYDSRIYRVIKALGLHEKIIFGSDFPLLPAERYIPDIEAANFSNDEKLLIFSSNILKILP